jgi:16S rRNA (uracil1498-N3)-methyltransferase
MPRFFIENPIVENDRVELSGSEAKHITKVLRLGPGAGITLFDGSGNEYEAKIESASTSSVTAEIRSARQVSRELNVPIHFYPALLKGGNFELVLQKATELGAGFITPLITERVVVKLDDRDINRKIERWQSIVTGAAKQCGRNIVPKINRPQALTKAVDSVIYSGIWALFCWEDTGAESGAIPLMEALPPHPGAGIAVFIGPEGGFTTAEMRNAADRGARLVSLGKRILRAETAAIAALAGLSMMLDR